MTRMIVAGATFERCESVAAALRDLKMTGYVQAMRAVVDGRIANGCVATVFRDRDGLGVRSLATLLAREHEIRLLQFEEVAEA